MDDETKFFEKIHEVFKEKNDSDDYKQIIDMIQKDREIQKKRIKAIREKYRI